MEKVIYILIILSGIRIVFINGCELLRLYKAYRIFVYNGFCPSEMDMECTCEKCQAIADSMSEEEKISDKKDHYHFVKDKLKDEVMNNLSYTIFYLSIVILATIKYFN